MKASALLQYALDNNYSNLEESSYVKKSPYMCHALPIALNELNADLYALSVARGSFADFIRDAGAITLMVALFRTDKVYNAKVRRYGHGAKCAFNYRVQWWNAHIAKLISQGL
jgi:hypothetical protein